MLVILDLVDATGNANLNTVGGKIVLPQNIFDRWWLGSRCQNQKFEATAFVSRIT